jgi:predicted DNA-binding protein
METEILIDPDLTPWLDRMVKEYGHNRLYWLMEAARAGRENVEDTLIADRVMEDIRQGRERTYTDEELERELGLAE